LFPFETGDVLSLPLRRATINAVLTDAGGSGKLTGLIDALDAAQLMESVPAVFEALLLDEATAFGGGAPIACEGDFEGRSAQCQDLNAPQSSFCSDRLEDGIQTGLCVTANTASALIYEVLDNDRDSDFNVIFNETSGQFVANELALLFNLSDLNQSPPTGLMGSLFTIDTDANGVSDAMPIGVRFTAVPAVRVD
jgi:hypothetical protein